VNNNNNNTQQQPKETMNIMTNNQRFTNKKREIPSRKLLLAEPMETDVLCGRGNVYATRPGNKAFQNIVRNNVQSYSEAKGRLEKVDIVDNVMNQIQNSGARIVKIDNTTMKWYELTDVEAHQKCGHCLRDTIRLHGKENNDSSITNRTKQSSVAMKKQREIRQVRTVVRRQQYQPINDTTDEDTFHCNNHNTETNCNNDILDIVSFYSEFEKKNHRLSLLADWNSDDDDNYSINPTTTTTTTTSSTRIPRRQSSSYPALFEDEFPEPNIVYSASIFFNQ